MEMKCLKKETERDVQAAGMLQVAEEPDHMETTKHENCSSTSCDAVTHDGDKKNSEEGIVESERKSTKKLMQCLSCQKVLERKMKRCRSCGSGCYCSKECKEEHASDHGEICNYIQQLEEMEKNKIIMMLIIIMTDNNNNDGDNNNDADNNDAGNNNYG